eukprot:6173071-Pleurochrysis_carterae.AAC.2
MGGSVGRRKGTGCLVLGGRGRRADSSPNGESLELQAMKLSGIWARNRMCRAGGGSAELILSSLRR